MIAALARLQYQESLELVPVHGPSSPVPDRPECLAVEVQLHGLGIGIAKYRIMIPPAGAQPTLP